MPTSSSSPMRYYSWLTANVLLPISILLFAVGFFPYKPFIPGLATLEDDDNDAIAGGGEGGNASGGALAEPVFDKVIYMVVDALR
ncbi:major facilitator super transporter protein, partial [Ascosphaera aggregata]